MNNVIVALQEEQVSVAIGKTGSRPELRALYCAQVHSGSIAAWETALREIFEAHPIPRRNVTLVLPGTAVTTRTITAPKMSARKLEKLVCHEMQSRSEQEMISDYRILSEAAGGRLVLYCTACQRSVLEEYLAMCSRLQLKVSRITEPLAGYLRLLEAMDEMKGKTCVWLTFEGNSMQSILIENGKYRYSTRSRIFSEPGTIDFGTEVSRSISGMLQFHAAQRSEYSITDVYYAGCEDDTFEVCLSALQSMGLKAGRLPDSACVRVTQTGRPLSDCAVCAGAV